MLKEKQEEAAEQNQTGCVGKQKKFNAKSCQAKKNRPNVIRTVQERNCLLYSALLHLCSRPQYWIIYGLFWSAVVPHALYTLAASCYFSHFFVYRGSEFLCLCLMSLSHSSCGYFRGDVVCLWSPWAAPFHFLDTMAACSLSSCQLRLAQVDSLLLQLRLPVTPALCFTPQETLSPTQEAHKSAGPKTHPGELLPRTPRGHDGIFRY